MNTSKLCEFRDCAFAVEAGDVSAVSCDYPYDCVRCLDFRYGGVDDTADTFNTTDVVVLLAVHNPKEPAAFLVANFWTVSVEDVDGENLLAHGATESWNIIAQLEDPSRKHRKPKSLTSFEGLVYD